MAPAAGARAFVFEDKSTHRSIFTTVGALRDDVVLEPPLSTTDRIAKYTHQFPAGMFNRPYRAEILTSGTRAVARFSYDAPDVVPAGAHFTRTITLAPNARVFSLDENATFAGDAAAQRAVSVTSLAVGASTDMKSERVLTPDPSAFVAGVSLPISGSNALGYYDTASHELATVAWRPGDVEDARLLERQYSIVARLVLTPGRNAHIEFGYALAETLDAARAALNAAGLAAQGRVANFSKPSAEGKWRNGLRDRLKSG